LTAVLVVSIQVHKRLNSCARLQPVVKGDAVTEGLGLVPGDVHQMVSGMMVDGLERFEAGVPSRNDFIGR